VRAVGYPRMVRVRQRVEALAVTDVRTAVRDELARIGITRDVRRGESIAITAGSRGIVDIVPVLQTVVAVLREAGADPFLVPAMGSHGGATAEGQVKVLATYGITEASIGAPIRSAMEVVQVGTTDEGIPAYVDRLAAAADRIVVVARIKPHTDFDGSIGSGFLKMLAIGLAKEIGASTCHRAVVHHGFERVLRSVAHVVLAQARIACGLAIVENAAEGTAILEAVKPGEMETREEALHALATRLMLRLPVDPIDLLIVDEIGKNVSGLGMDTNVVGRKPMGDGAGAPHIRRIFVRDLTPETHGNALGVGLADFATSRLVRAIDYRATVVNALAAAHPEAAVIPVHFESDREVIDAALATVGLTPPEQTRVVRIRNTLRLRELEVSEACAAEMTGRAGLDVVSAPEALAFDPAGNLEPLAPAPHGNGTT
jgi:lactate racemase-like protein